MAEIQASNAALRAAAQQRTPATDLSSSSAQLAALETLLERRDKEVGELRQALAGSSGQLQKLALQGELVMQHTVIHFCHSQMNQSSFVRPL